MTSPEKARKLQEARREYRKVWYRKNREKIREDIRNRYHETVTKKRMEEALASLSDNEWKPVPGFEDYRVNRNGEIKNKFGKTLKAAKLANGYMHVSLSSKTVKRKHIYVHQVVWLAFNGEVPDGLIICHKDTNRENNSLDNLTVMTYKENFNKPLTIEHFKRSQELYPRTKGGKEKKKVFQYDSDGNLVNTWDSILSTSEGGFSPSGVSKCASGKIVSYRGYVWSTKEVI